MSTQQTHSPANLPGGPDKWERVRDGNSQAGDYAVWPDGYVESLSCLDDDSIHDFWENEQEGQIVHVYRSKDRVQPSAEELAIATKVEDVAYWKQRAEKAEREVRNKHDLAQDFLYRAEKAEADLAKKIATLTAKDQKYHALIVNRDQIKAQLVQVTAERDTWLAQHDAMFDEQKGLKAQLENARKANERLAEVLKAQSDIIKECARTKRAVHGLPIFA